ncbi:hypothetical protein IV203_013961 [Nitzschia inconspicua]|uniref:Uncharacterized protein n=1 Tax=Nitzschia inconspicua TaxID=303405 RepID=A0A9K3M9F4_9STRA|nr:hypothetical protein IV203_013961 [Nitzschia inconspicua]
MEKLVTVDVFWSSSSSTPSLQLPEWGSKHWTHGVAPIMLASFISGLSGALSQRNLQAKGGGRNPYLFRMELCAASSLILLCSLDASPDGQQIAQDGFWKDSDFHQFGGGHHCRVGDQKCRVRALL